MRAGDFALDGVYVAAVTPFDADGALDAAGWEPLVGHFVAGGLRGMVVAGTTGEYYALTDAERAELFEVARDVNAGRLQLIAGCNSGATREVVHHGLRARELGYDALMLSVPHTSLPTPDELYEHFALVAREVDLPVVLYNFPARAGVSIDVDTLERLAEVEQIIALKEASGDFSRFLEITRRLGDRLAVSCGSDDQAYDYFAWGVESWIAGTANVLPREHVEVLAAVRRGDLAGGRQLHTALLPWIQLMEGGRYNQKAKLGLALQGIHTGNVRRPLVPLRADEAAEYGDVLSAAMRAAAEVHAGLVG